VQLVRQRHCSVGTAVVRNTTLQRYTMYAAICVAAAGGAWLLSSNGSRRHQLNFILFFSKILAVAREKKKEKGKGSFETCSKISIQHECNTQASSRSNSSSNLRSLLALPPCAPSGSNNTTPVVTTQELQKCKNSVAFNMKQQEIKFF
jgi:hypothetical protein